MASYSDNESLDFVNFPETNLQAAFSTRAILMEPGISPTLFSPRDIEVNSIQFVSELIKSTSVPEGSVSNPFYIINFDKPALLIKSPCPTKPARLPLVSSSTQVQSYVRESDFSVLQKKISLSLSSMPQFDFSYDESSFMWRGKTIVGARFLEIAVRCFWDKKLQDHLVTVHKLAGDLCRQQECGPSAILQHLKVSLQLCKINEEGRAKPLFMRSNPVATANVNTTNNQNIFNQKTTETNYFQCLKTVQEMLQSQFLDMHMEAACMFYEIVSSHKDITCAKCEQLSCDILQFLLLAEDHRSLPYLLDASARDASYDEAVLIKQQCAVLAFQLLLSYRHESNSLLISWALREGCMLLWKLICDNLYTKTTLYMNIATRRVAATLLVQLLSHFLRTTPNVREHGGLVYNMLYLWQEQGVSHTVEDIQLSRLCAEGVVPLLALLQ